MAKAKMKNGLTIDTDYRINGKGSKLFGIYNPDQEIAGFFFGHKKASLWLDAFEDDPAALISLLREYCGRSEAVKTIEYDGDIYGLMQDGSIKIRKSHEGSLYWCDKIGRKGKQITPETFDNPESLSVPTAPASRSSGKLAELQAKLDAQAEQTAQFQAMMMQFMQAQMAK